MEIRHLETFLAVARVGSVTRAAFDTKYSQSTITEQLRALERSVDATLFTRSRRGVELTEAGQRFHSYASRILVLSEEARRAVKQSTRPTGQIVLGTMESLNAYRVAALVEECQNRYPDLRIVLRTGHGIDPLKALQHSAYDCALVVDSKTRHTDLVTNVLFEEPLVLVGFPNHPLRAAESLTLDHLRHERVLVTEPGCAYREAILESLAHGKVEPVPPLEFGTIEAIKRGVGRGLGVSVLPEITVEREVLDGDLIVLPWQPPFTVYTQLVWHEEKLLSPGFRTFVDLVTKTLLAQVGQRGHAARAG